VAKREPKFDFRGRAGETSNPLFRGFGDQGRETAERYDQPVLTRLNTRDELELRAGFPKTPEELYGFRAIILDDIEAEFFHTGTGILAPKIRLRTWWWIPDVGGHGILPAGAVQPDAGRRDVAGVSRSRH
jgi:hypothetical protein